MQGGKEWVAHKCCKCTSEEPPEEEATPTLSYDDIHQKLTQAAQKCHDMEEFSGFRFENIDRVRNMVKHHLQDLKQRNWCIRRDESGMPHMPVGFFDSLLAQVGMSIIRKRDKIGPERDNGAASNRILFLNHVREEFGLEALDEAKAEMWVRMQAVDDWAKERYKEIPLAIPTELEVGNRVVFNNNNRWTCSKRIECECECGQPHKGWIMRHQYETQLWWDTDTVWESTVLLKDWPAKKVIMDEWRDKFFGAMHDEEPERLSTGDPDIDEIMKDGIPDKDFVEGPEEENDGN
jgi:hypothetical protein